MKNLTILLSLYTDEEKVSTNKKAEVKYGGFNSRSELILSIVDKNTEVKTVVEAVFTGGYNVVEKKLRARLNRCFVTHSYDNGIENISDMKDLAMPIIYSYLNVGSEQDKKTIKTMCDVSTTIFLLMLSDSLGFNLII